MNFRPALAKTPPFRNRLATRGVALVIVLAFLVLISVLVIAFFSSVTTELSSAKSYAFGTNARQLADSSVQAVMGQIRDATTKGGETAWSSQPGMIRTYDNTGAPANYFKLYSSDNMVVTKSQISGFTPGVDVDTAWNTKPGLFTDLNSPVLVADASNPNSTYPVFPIIDPRAMGQGSNSPVEGFSYSAKVGAGNVSGVVTPGSSSDNAARLPMPVRWLYVLRDGTLTAPTVYDASRQAASWSGAPSYKTPSATNPIVGRIAFWADDETCKININTASEPTPWDTPRSVDIQDLNYGKFQPAQFEYQRFPGHPYATALSPVFFPNTVLTSSQRQAIYEVVPRVAWGGSESGTRPVGPRSDVALDADRLFASVDEFLLKPDRTLNGLVDAEALKRSRFFLTANSRAPEVNLFGQPRVSIWPVNSNDSSRTAFDRLAAFCSTVGDANASLQQNFSFQRSDATSPTSDWTNIPRNQDLIKYLKRLTSANIPGFGGNFLAKWSDDRDQVLTEIFDYIRCVNLRDNSSGATKYTSNGQVAPIRIDTGNTKGFGRFQTISQFGIHFICGQDGPSGLSTVAGSGVTALTAGQRYIEATLLFEPFSPSLGYHELMESLSYQVTVKSPMSVNGTDLQFPSAMVTKASNSSFGGIWHGRWWGGAQGIRGMIKSFGSGSYPLVSKRTQVAASGATPTMAFSGGTVEVKVYAGTTPSASNLVQTFSFILPGGTFPVPKLVTTGTEAYRGCVATDANTWWSIAKRYAGVGACPHAPGSEYADPTRRWGANTGTGWKQGGVFRAEDVVRTLVPEHGDIRLIAAQPNPPSTLFVKGSRYDDSTRMLDHLFQEPQGPHMLYGFGNEPGLTSAVGDQLTTATYHYARNPEIRPGAGKLYNKWNDFDSGFAHLQDGAYINKPDEGNIASQNSVYPYFSWDFDVPTPNLFSPNRLAPSAGMLGSLPTGVKRNQPWQTLLFRPELTKDSSGNPHPGTVSPKDHLLMDLFWMPVIEPYAVSEPFSTAGKINLNYAIAPFSYIRRATGLYGVMKSEEPLLIPNSASRICKLWDHETNDWPSYPNNAKSADPAVRADWDKLYKGLAPFDKLRRPVKMDETLKQFDDRFAAGEAFRSASEICEIHLVRDGELLSDYTANSIWPNNLVTGENTRERPYTNLYARLTTKSNSYTVHMRVQVLKKKATTNAADDAVWREGTDQVVSEFRGATLLERYLDSGATFPDFVTNSSSGSVEDFYKFRTISTKRFVP